MKKLVVTSIVLLSIIVCNGNVQAQSLLEYAKKKTEKVKRQAAKKGEEKADVEIDKLIDKGFNKLDNLGNKQDSSSTVVNDQVQEPDAVESQPTTNHHQSNSSSSEQARFNSLMGALGVETEEVHYENEYVFHTKLRMKFTSFDASGNETSSGDFTTYMNNENSNFAYEAKEEETEKQSLFIYDLKNQCNIILGTDENEKSGMVLGINSEMSEAFQQASPEDYEDMEDMSTYNPNLKKTGKTKSINGYTCDQYVYKDSVSYSEIWITKEIDMNMNNATQSVLKTSTYMYGMPYGFMMAFDAKDLETNERSTMQVIEIEDNKKTRFDLSGYNITNIGSFKIPNETEQ